MKRFTEQITLEEMSDELKREIAMRQRVYPQWIISGKINEQTAAFRVLVLQATANLIHDKIKAESPQQDLFQ